MKIACFHRKAWSSLTLCLALPRLHVILRVGQDEALKPTMSIQRVDVNLLSFGMPPVSYAIKSCTLFTDTVYVVGFVETSKRRKDLRT